MRTVFAVKDGPAHGCVDFDTPGNALWWAAGSGDLHSLRIADGRHDERGGGYVDPVGVGLGNDGLSVWVVEAAGVVLRAARSDAARAAATTLVDLAEPVVAAASAPDGPDLLVLTAAGRLARVDEAGAVADLASGFTVPRALAVAAQQVVVLETGDALRVVDLATGDVGPALPIGSADAVTVLTAGGPPAALLAGGLQGSLAATDLTGVAVPGAADVGGPVRALTTWGSLVVAATAGSIVALDWDLDEAGPLAIRVPVGPMSVGGYAHVEVDLAAAGLTRGDVEVVVEEGAGFVSAGREPDGAGGARFALCAGPQPGEYHVSVLRSLDGTVLGRRRFRTTARWYDDEVGPPVVVTGARQLFARGSWGGGPTGPQNVNVHAAPETWRVLTAFVDLNDQRYGASIATETATFDAALFGPGPCVRTWYEETSLHDTAGPAIPRGTTIDRSSLGVLGPLHLDLGWGDAFDPGDPGDVWRGWDPKESFFEACADAISSALADAGAGRAAKDAWDAVVIVVATASNDKVTVGGQDMPAKFVWPQANGTNFYAKDGISFSQFPKPILCMPDRYPTAMPAAQVLPHFPVLCHELGHTLGLEDLYNTGDLPAEIAARAIGELDFMGSEFSLPHPSIGNKLRLGWVHPTWFRSFDFSASPVGDTVTLHAVDSLTRNGPPPGRRAGIEVRIEDGWNYYFEHRRTVPGHVADQGLAANAGAGDIVLGTDVRADGAGRPARPVILRLGDDADHDGAVLSTAAQDYEETDTTNTNRQHDFRLVVDSIDPVDADAIRVKVEYVAAHRPQLQVRPAPGRGDWKSPDIDLDGPGGPNRIVKGHRHQVVVRVTNLGVLQADAVRVGLKWLPFTTSAGSWNALADPPKQDIAPGATATFVQDWDVPADLKIGDVDVEHFCVRVDVDAYVDPRDPGNNEIVVFDNWAQSNFDTTTVDHGSPSRRRWTGVQVTNPLDVAATYSTLPEQDSEWFRTYVGNAWLRLAPGATATVEVGYESLAGDRERGDAFDNAFAEGGFRRPARISFNSFVRRHRALLCESRSPVWGAGLSVRPGLTIVIRDVRLEGEVVRGTVTGLHDGAATPVGQGAVAVVLAPAAAPREETVLHGTMRPDGTFAVVVPGDLLVRVQRERFVVEVLYLGTTRWAFGRSGVEPLR